MYIYVYIYIDIYIYISICAGPGDRSERGRSGGKGEGVWCTSGILLFARAICQGNQAAWAVPDKRRRWITVKVRV